MRESSGFSGSILFGNLVIFHLNEHNLVGEETNLKPKNIYNTTTYVITDTDRG